MMDTVPMPLEPLAQAHGDLDDFRITSRIQIKTMLRQLAEAAIPLSINGPDGSMLSTVLWTVDSMRDAISFSASVDDPHLEAIVHGNEGVVVGYIDSVKLQFDAHDLVLVHAGRSAALSCAMPSVIYRFQRRGSFRVRPILRSSPMARFDHPESETTEMELRVLDVSIGGCALFMPEDVPQLRAGVKLQNVELALDADTRVKVTLRIHHLSSLNADAKGLRLGCEMLRLSAPAERLLQLYIDQTQKRRRLMALD